MTHQPLRIAVRCTLLLVVAAGFSVSAEQSVGFVLDQSRPYVYIQFDHVGPRVPVSEVEPAIGVWLRIKNNSRVPIQVSIFDLGTKDTGVGVLDEIVPVPGIAPPCGSGGSAIRPPIGYQVDVATPATIPPGHDLLFSVPISHVAQWWYLRVRFGLVLPAAMSGRQPYSFVDFAWSDIPDKDRAAWKPSVMMRR